MKENLKRILIFLLTYIVMFGIVALAVKLGSALGGPIAIIVLLALAVPGWKFIDFITPALFIWMPLAGWVIYCKVCRIGVFRNFYSSLSWGKKITGRRIISFFVNLLSIPLVHLLLILHKIKRIYNNTFYLTFAKKRDIIIKLSDESLTDFKNVFGLRKISLQKFLKKVFKKA